MQQLPWNAFAGAERARFLPAAAAAAAARGPLSATVAAAVGMYVQTGRH